MSPPLITILVEPVLTIDHLHAISSSIIDFKDKGKKQIVTEIFCRFYRLLNRSHIANKKVRAKYLRKLKLKERANCISNSYRFFLERQQTTLQELTD